MHEAIYANSHRLSPELLVTIAAAMGLSEAALRDALAARTYAPKVKEDFFGGIRSGVAGTPTFFINGKRHEGTYEARDLIVAIQSVLHAPAGSV